MASLVLPDSNFYIDCARAGRDPFQVLGAFAHDWEFATCGIVVSEVCRGRSDPFVLQRFRERFAVMIYLPTTHQVWERTLNLAWTLDRRGAVLQLPDLIIAASALISNAAVLTHDAAFKKIPGLTVLEELV